MKTRNDMLAKSVGVSSHNDFVIMNLQQAMVLYWCFHILELEMNNIDKLKPKILQCLDTVELKQ